MKFSFEVIENETFQLMKINKLGFVICSLFGWAFDMVIMITDVLLGTGLLIRGSVVHL